MKEYLKIKNVTVVEKKLDLVAPFETSFGRFDKKTHYYPQITFENEKGEEFVGIGECPPLPAPWYDGEDEHTVKAINDNSITPALQKHKSPIHNVEEFINIYGFVVGNGMAKVGYEGAYWDALCKSKGLPVHKLWSGSKIEVEAGTSVGLEKTPESMLKKIGYAVNQMGVNRVKIKIKPGSDVDFVKAIRDKYPTLKLQVDANAAYNLFNPDHIAALQKLDKYNLLMIEQPGPNDDILDHATQLSSLSTPICLDESILHVRHARQAIELWKEHSSLDKLIINIKPPRVGGFWEAIKIAKLCEEHDVKTWCGGMLESAVGKMANAHFSTISAVNLPGDHVSQGDYYKKDVAKSPAYEKGQIKLNNNPGWGLEDLKL